MDRYTGQLAALSAALCWAVGSLIFSRVPVPAAALNLFKNSVGSVALLILLVVTCASSGDAVFHATGEAWLWLALSGLVGILIGDTCYFRSLQILGPRRATVVFLLAPPLAAVTSFFVLGETLRELAYLGMAVTLGGVVCVVRERGGKTESAGHFPGTVARGVVYGALGSLCQALGSVLSKHGMGELKPLEATSIRLLAAAVLGVLLAQNRGRLKEWCRRLAAPGVLWRAAIASLLGTAIGIWLSLVAFKYTKVGIATTLTCTSPIFVLPLVRVFLKQKVSVRAIVGAVLALAGVVLLFDGAGE